MHSTGLILSYRNGINTVHGRAGGDYPVGDLLCQIFQGETLYNISIILRNCINACPMRSNVLSQDEIEDAERYILQSLMYDDFYPAQRLAQGSFIRYMEYYRAMDSVTAKKLLEQEIQRSETGNYLFEDIGFDTVGDYLRLCYNNYLIDLSNGISLFTATSSEMTGTATEEEHAQYNELCDALGDEYVVPGTEMKTTYDASNGTFEYRFVISSFLSMAVFEFSHMKESSIRILRCQNPECGKFFAAKRSSAKYCEFPAPQHPGQPCNTYYPQFVYRKKEQTDELTRLAKNARCRLLNARRRHPEQAADITKQLRDLAIHSSEKISQVQEGNLSKIKFSEWLNSHTYKKGQNDDE